MNREPEVHSLVQCARECVRAAAVVLFRYVLDEVRLLPAHLDSIPLVLRDTEDDDLALSSLRRVAAEKKDGVFGCLSALTTSTRTSSRSPGVNLIVTMVKDRISLIVASSDHDTIA
jgi:hypothetical protein